MSSLNGRRQVGHGLGGGNASIDNVAFSRGGWAGWISDDAAFFANGADGWVCSVYEPSTGTIRRAVADPADTQFGVSMNSGMAGGGVWAAWFGSQGAERGLFTSTGLHFPDAGLLGVGPAGELAFKVLYQSFGPVVVLERLGQERVAALGGGPAALQALEGQLRADGLLWTLSTLTGADYQLLGGGRAIWQYGQRLQVAGLPAPLQVGQAYGPRAYLLDGRWWVSYFSTDAGIVLHPFDELNGIVIVPASVSMWHSARSFGSEVAFALSPSEAEQDGQLLPLAVVDTRTAVRRPLQPPAPPLRLPAPARKYWAGWFEFAPAPHGPGNAMLAVRNMAGALDRPAIVSSESDHLLSGTKLGCFIGGGSVEEIEAAAKASTLRPVAYWDGNAWPRWPALPKGAWLCLRMYCDAGKSSSVFKAEGEAVLRAAPAGVAVVIVGQQYTSNADLVGYVDTALPPPHASEALKPLAVALVELANAHANVVGLFLFSGFGRRGGLMDHPDLVDAWAAWSAQLQAPSVEPYPTPAPPPPKPPPVPPPPRLFAQHKEYRMSTKQIVLIIGPAGKAGRPDKPNTGPWGSIKDDAGQLRGWAGVIWDGDPNNPTDKHKFELTFPDGRHQLYHPTFDGFFGADATAYATKPGSDQFYIKPAKETRGGYESPVIYEGNVTPGLLSGQVEYIDEQTKQPFVSCAFAVKVLS